MRAMLCTAFGGLDGLELGDIEPPRPEDDEVLIDVSVASVNVYGLLDGVGRLPVAP